MLYPFHFHTSDSRDGIRTIRTLRHLLPFEEDDTDAWRSKAKTRLRKLLKRRVDGISGRQVYVADMMLKSIRVNSSTARMAWSRGPNSVSWKRIRVTLAVLTHRSVS
eukprot:5657486-Amphidinium_carterae.2